MFHAPMKRIATHLGPPLLKRIEDSGLSVHWVARDIALPGIRLHEIVHERCGLSAETAIELGTYFG